MNEELVMDNNLPASGQNIAGDQRPSIAELLRAGCFCEDCVDQEWVSAMQSVGRISTCLNCQAAGEIERLLAPSAAIENLIGWLETQGVKGEAYDFDNHEEHRCITFDCGDLDPLVKEARAVIAKATGAP